MIARWPRPDPVYQEFIDEQIIIAKKRILAYPQINKLFDNFAHPSDIPYTKLNNKILKLCMQRPQTIPKKYIDPQDTSDEVIPFETDEQGYPDNVILLENSLLSFDIDKWNANQYNSFKERITSNDHFTSESAFGEITIAHRLGKKFGVEKIKYEPSLLNGKNPDILVNFDGKKIYLELTALTETKAGGKIESIFEHGADYLGEKISKDKPTIFKIWVDTTKLIHKGKHIDESKSKEMMCDSIDKLHLDKLVGSKGIFHFDDLKLDTAISGFLDKKLSEYPHPRYNLGELLQDESIKKWAEHVIISDIINSPFATIGLENRESFSSVELQEDALHSTYTSANSELFPSVKTADLQEKSFLNHIKRRIKFKIDEQQYQIGSPIVIMIKGELWSNMYETDVGDFSKIKKLIEDTLSVTSHVSGVLLYHSDYTNGKYIHNTNANQNIRLNDDTITQLFSD